MPPARGSAAFCKITHVDPLTHALASYTLKRAAFPQLARPATVVVVLAGTLADLDMLSSSFGPSAYLAWNRTYVHSALAAFVLALLASLPFFFLKTNAPEKSVTPLSVFIPAAAAAMLHLLLDLCQFQGIEMFWPFTAHRYSLDWFPLADLPILGLFIAAVLLPKLARLVSEEIGARSKGPRGRTAAIFVLALVGIYIGARALLHANAVATLDARTYRGEMPKSVAAIPAVGRLSLSGGIFAWDGLVETDRAIYTLGLEVGPGSTFDPESARPSYKPEPSPALTAALRTVTAQRLLAATRFPKASVEKMLDGYRVLIRSFPYDAGADYGRRVQAIIDVDAAGKVLSETLAWDPASEQHWWY